MSNMSVWQPIILDRLISKLATTGNCLNSIKINIYLGDFPPNILPRTVPRLHPITAQTPYVKIFGCHSDGIATEINSLCGNRIASVHFLIVHL